MNNVSLTFLDTTKTGFVTWRPMRGSRGGGGGGVRGDRGPEPPPPPPLKNYKNIPFLSNTGTDSLKIKKLPSQHSSLGHIDPAVKRHLKAFRWRAGDGLLIVVFGSSPLISYTHKKNTKKAKVGPPSDKTFWITAWDRYFKVINIVVTGWHVSASGPLVLYLSHALACTLRILTHTVSIILIGVMGKWYSVNVVPYLS